jgi:predicted lipid-binding transport protein (Tim44 family)
LAAIGTEHARTRSSSSSLRGRLGYSSDRARYGSVERGKDVFDNYTIILLALAIIIILLKLRSVLGPRTGRGRPPGISRSTDTTPASADAEPVDGAERWKGIAEPVSSVASGLDAIARKDKSFTAHHFLSGAQTAYEMIVLAYAQGDRRALRNLLSREVYEGFEAAIREREAKGETVESRFVAIEKSDITAVELRNRMAQLTVRFVSQLISVTRDKAGNVIDGDPEKVTDITDVWTFARDLSSRDPNWKLVATEAGHEKEQGAA